MKIAKRLFIIPCLLISNSVISQTYSPEQAYNLESSVRSERNIKERKDNRISINHYGVKPLCDVSFREEYGGYIRDLGKSYMIELTANYSPFVDYDRFVFGDSWGRLEISTDRYNISIRNVNFISKDSVEIFLDENEFLKLSKAEFFEVFYPSDVFEEGLYSPRKWSGLSSEGLTSFVEQCQRNYEVTKAEAESKKSDFHKPMNRLKRFFN